MAEHCHKAAAHMTSDGLLRDMQAGGIPCVILGKFRDKYTLPDQIEHNLENGYLVKHTYDGEGASGKTIYVNQFPLYFESQGLPTTTSRATLSTRTETRYEKNSDEAALCQR